LSTQLIEPHGGQLKDLYLSPDVVAGEKAKARELLSWDMNQRQICDVELLLNGGFSPLEGFLGQADYEGVVTEMRLTNGTLWPMPVNLDVTEEFGDQVSIGEEIALRDPEGVLIALLQISDKWVPDRRREAVQVFGSDDVAHPGVDYALNRANPVYLGGSLKGIEPPHHYDFKHLRDTPADVRRSLVKRGWRRLVAFQTRNPMHRAHVELTVRASQQVEANLLIHPVVGMTKPGDVDHFSRVRCYEEVLRNYPEQTTKLSLFPLAMRMGGPREALWHALIRKNFGCTHFIVGRDHAGPGKNGKGEDFYGPYDAQELVTEYRDEIGIEMVPFQAMVYVQDRAEYMPASEVGEGQTILNISGTEFRRRLQQGLEIPEWFSYPEVVRELRKTYPARDKQGFTVFFTGLSGAGKSTIANALMVKLMELGGRRITLLDGDVVRKHLSSELGFSREHRDLNVQRIGYVASEITKNGGIAVCAPIAPYRIMRREVRDMIEEVGSFIEVHVSTPIEICEERDRKGLYAKARAGLIKGFTGIDDPYELPEHPELRIDSSECTPDQAAQRVILKLESMGYIRAG
jgi:sulfate adenylyltransferase